jgi:RNA polymerase primary sigma factor
MSVDHELDSSLKLYMREIGKIPLLNRKQERELAEKIHGDDPVVREEARITLIESNLKLVVKIAYGFKNLGMPVRDLISAGNVGLMRAAEKYDPDKGARFGTYSTWWIKQAVRASLDNHSRTIRIPVQAAANLKKVKTVIKKLKNELGREPTSSEVADQTEFSERTVNSLKRMVNLHFMSLDETLNQTDAEERTYKDVIPDKSSISPDNIMSHVDSIDELYNMLQRLDERERLVLVKRFGLDGAPPMTLKEVAKLISRTRERVRQIQGTAFDKVMKMLEGN